MMYSFAYFISGLQFNFGLKVTDDKDAKRFLDTAKAESANFDFKKTREIFRDKHLVWCKYNVFLKNTKYNFELFIKEGTNLNSFEKEFKETLEADDKIIDSYHTRLG